jgi:hypothetical protein
MICSEKALNPIQTWLPGFSSMHHYAIFDMTTFPLPRVHSRSLLRALLIRKNLVWQGKSTLGLWEDKKPIMIIGMRKQCTKGTVEIIMYLYLIYC